MGHINKALKRWKEVILITLIIRIVLFTITGWNLNSWVQWDGPHYLDIASHGYVTSGMESYWIVFYPLYPFLIKILTLFIHNFSLSSIYISVFFSITSSILLFELCLLDFDKKTSILAVWFLNIYPTSYFLQASYTESLFLTLSLSAIYFFRRGKLATSLISGALSSLTRINGLLLIPSLLLETKSFKNRLTTLVITPIGFLIYLLINYLTFGSPLYFQKPLYFYYNRQNTKQDIN